MSDERIWTAAVLVIGDEILSGRTQDKNVAQVETWLDVQGIRLREVRIVPDVEDEIVAALNALLGALDRSELVEMIDAFGGFADSVQDSVALPGVDAAAVVSMKRQ